MNNKEASPIGDLGRDPMRIVLRHLSPLDQLHTARASRSLYALFGQPAQKNLVYSFSVIPEGALEHPIFVKHAPNFPALVKFLRIRTRNQRFIASEFLYFDYEEVWPLAAIMGNEAALRELIGHDPKRVDANGKTALDYLAFCGHKTIMVNWIRDFYPDFEREDAPQLHFYAALGGSEEIVFMLIEEFDYDMNDSGDKRGWSYDRVTILHAALWGKHTALLRRLIDAGGDLNKSHPFEDSLALNAYEMGLWDFYEEFKAMGVDQDVRNNHYLFIEAAACLNRQDDLMIFIKRRVADDGSFYEYEHYARYIPGEHICHAAIRSGQKEIVDLCVEKGWVDIRGVFSSKRTDKKTEDKDPALFVAAEHGQLEMIDHLVEKYGLDPHIKHLGEFTVLQFLISRTTWSNFEYIAQKYFAHEVDLPTNVESLPLTAAIGSGDLYNTQQYIKKYCDDNFLREFGNKMISFAEESGNPYLIKWLKNKIAALNSSKVQTYSIEEANSGSKQLSL